MQLRPYQEEAADAVREEHKKVRSTMIVLPTACGKTVCFSEVIRRNPGRALLLTHREELIWQGSNKLQAMMPHEEVAIEMAEFQASLKYGTLPKVVVASVQSLHAKRIRKFDPKMFDLVVADECHRVMASEKTLFGRAFAHFKQNDRCRFLGVTATPDRHDGKAMGSVFDSVAYEYTIPQAMNDGYICPLEQNLVTITSLDLSTLSTYMGDLSAGSLDEVMSTERNIMAVAYPTLELSGSRKTLIFCAGVHQAYRLAEIMNRERAGCAVAMDGTTNKNFRRETLQRFAAGEFQYLVNVGLFTEGFDAPDLGCIAMARPTKSRSLFTQMIGRGFRVLPNVIEGENEDGTWFQLETAEERRAAIQRSAKRNCLILDFTGNSGKHRLVHPADILGGTADEPLSDEITEIINTKTEKATAAKESVNVAQAIDEAKEELKAKKQLEELLEAERIAKLREVVRAKVQYTLKTISPLDVFSLPEAPKGNIGMDFAKRPTETQVKALRDNGVDVHYDQGDWWIGPPKFKAEWQKITQGTAGKLLNSLKERRKQNICSYKQAMLLARFGEDPHCSFQDAKRIIDEIAKNNWQPRKKTIDDLAEQQARQGAEHVKFKWVEKRQLTAEAVAWMTKERDDAYTKPEKKRYLDNCLKLNRIPLGCPIKDAIQTTQERVAVEVKVPTKKAPQKPKVQQAIDF